MPNSYIRIAYGFSETFTMKAFSRLLLLSIWLIFFGGAAGIPALAQTMTKASPVKIEDADRILRARVKTTPSAAVAQAKPAAVTTIGCASSSSQPVEIVTLANSLKCDIDLIFEYVYNNIEYEPLFGSNKGALGTLLDQRGSDIDQAQLFVALLNVSGITQTSFIYGYITVTGTTTPTSPCTATWIAPAPSWLGVNNDLFAIKNLLGNGGIPLANGVYNSSNGNIECLDVAHVWVQVTIDGSNYVFDPSFKQHTVSTGLSNLGSILGYTQSQFLADAGGTIGADSSISNINRTKIRSDLTTYANNLVSYIKANNPAYSLDDVIGGKAIVPLTGSPIRQTSLPYLSTSQPSGFPQNWGAGVPNAYRTCLAISMPGVTSDQPCGSATSQTIVLYSDQTYGQRITVFSTPDPSISGNYIPTLLVNGATPINGTNTGPSTAAGQPWGIYVAISHPYTTVPGVNQSKALNVNAGGSYLVSAGWGRVGRGMVAKHQQLLAQALAVSGANPASEPILGESLAIISYHWLAENAAQQAIGDAIGLVTTQYHHGVGITAQTAIQSSGNQGPYIDLPLNFFTIGQQTCWPDLTCPFPTTPIVSAFYTDSGTGSSFESAVLQQTQAPTPNMIAASTMVLVDHNAATGAKTFFADGTTSAGQSNYINAIRPLLQQAGISYSATDLSAIDIAVTGASPPPASPTPTQSQVLAPVNGNQTVGLWQGAGYTIILQTGTSISITQKISGGLSGGESGTPVSTRQVVSNAVSTMPVTPANGQTPTISQHDAANKVIQEPIDAITGVDVYTHNDLTIGSGSFPYALPFGRTYLSSSNLTDIGMGNGWAHSYDLNAAAGSDPYAGMGASSPISAAAAIAAIYVSQNLLNTSTQSAQSLTLSWIVDRWLTDQLTNNAAFIVKPDTVEEYIALPHQDGAATLAYNAPLGSAIVLTGSGAGAGNPTSYTYATKDGVKLAFAPSPAGGSSLPVASWTWPNGMNVSFAYNSSGALTAVSNNLGRQLNLTYSGTHVASVSDGSRTVNYAYSGNNLASMSDPLGNVTTYAYDMSGTYDTAGHLTQIFYPTHPASAFVTNYYDGLGRVVQQKNANGAAWQFYFAGSRSEIVDALGNREVTYQTPRGKITKDAFVLSSSFGDVFNDTAQSNGVVNVTSNTYDGQDRVTLTTAPEGGTTGFTYSPDLEQNIISITQTAKPGSSLSPLTTSITYDPVWNKPTSITDPRGLITNISYDPATGNLLKMVADAGTGHFNATSRFAYNSHGQILKAIDQQAMLTTYAYDGFGNPTSVIRDCCGAGHVNQTVTLTYDGLGNVISTTDPNGNVTKSTYDLDRRLLTTTLPGTAGAPSGLVTATTYDPDGRPVQARQSAGGVFLRQTSSAYSLSGKVLTSTDANGNVTRYTYDADDRLSSVADPIGRTTSIAYDALSRKIAVSNLAIQANPLVQQTYTPDGLVASLIVARANTTFNTTGLAYDGFDRLGTMTYPDASTQVLAYDADGNVLTRQTRASQTITYTYDTLNRLSTKAAPSEASVTYGYDLTGRLLGASDNSASITTPTSGGTVSAATFTYDPLNALTGSSWSPVQAQAPPTASAATFTYGYNGANQRTSQAATDNSYWSYPTAAATAVSYTANNLDQYTAIGSVTPTYDGNGNLTFDGTFTYSYDAESRLISASGAGNTASYAYDAQGRRKSKTLNGTTTLFVQDPQGRALLDYAGSGGAVTNWYAFGPGPNDVLNQVGGPATTRATYVPDIQGSVIASLDASSGTLTKAGFQPFGESGSTAGTFRYTGARIDAETNGLYNMRARMYSPTLGRFLQTDPVGTQGGINLYGYVGNDPLNLVDIFGLTADNPQGSGQNNGSLLAGVAIGATAVCVAAEPCGAAEGIGLATAVVLGAALGLSGDTAQTQTGVTSTTDSSGANYFYHGTSAESGLALLNGAPLSIEGVQQNTNGAPPGFYLATDPVEAQYFGSLKATQIGSTVLQYGMTNSAVSALAAAGATIGPIPQSGANVAFQGQQFVIPPSAFGVFNALRASGGITVKPSPLP
jgi:RHS repeat-associated protein